MAKYQDKFIFEGRIRNAFYDLEGDIWIEFNMDEISRKLLIKGSYVEAIRYIDDELLKLVKKDKLYYIHPQVFISKISLTKLTKKIYNLPDDFDGDVIIILEEKWCLTATIEYVNR